MPKWLNVGIYFALSLLLIDIAAIYAAIRLVHAYRVDWVQQIDLLPVVLVTVTTVLSLYVMNVYQFHRRSSATTTALRTFFGVAVAGLLVSSVLYATKSTDTTAVIEN